MNRFNNEPEEWSQVPGWSDWEVSSLGRIRRVGGEASLGSINSQGYRIKTLSRGKSIRCFRVHRLVMLAFVGPSELQVNHKNGNKQDNRLTNLEYCTHQENMIHAYVTGLNVPTQGEERTTAKLKELDVHAILALVANGLTDRYIADLFKVSKALVYQVKTGQRWKSFYKTRWREFVSDERGGEE